MFIRGMIDHQIHHDLKVPLMCLCEKPVKIIHSSKIIHDILIIGDIISVIVIRRFINGRNPKNIHSQLFQIIQFLNDPVQITDSISVAVHKTSGINLIDHAAFPPLFIHILPSLPDLFQAHRQVPFPTIPAF